VCLNQIEGDYTVPGELLRIDPAQFDHIVLLGSEWLDSEKESDARSITGYLLLLELFKDYRQGPEILIELMDPENIQLFQQRRAEVLVSPQMLSHMLAQVALRRELRSVFDELFGPGGAEIFFRPVTDYGLDGGPVDFARIQQAAAHCGETALGIKLDVESKTAGGGVYLNPDRMRQWVLQEQDELVVLRTYAQSRLSCY
jgi:hypothetical protein